MRNRSPCGTGFLAACLAWGAVAATPACQDARGPEARVLALLESAETAAEAHDVEALGGMISEHYADPEGRDEEALRALLAFHFLRNRKVHLLTRHGPVALPEPSRALVTSFVAMAGQPIPGPDALPGLRADLFRFDLELEEDLDGAWRLVRAGWRRAQPVDFR